MLGGLTTHEGTACLAATLGDTGDDRRDPLGHHLAGGDVVGHEQRLGTAHHEVVDDHRDEVDADGVVLVHALRHSDFGAHPISGCREERPLVAFEHGHVEQPGESAEVTDHLGPLGARDGCLHQRDSVLTCLDVDSCCRVRRGPGVVHGRRSVHGRLSASAAPPPPSRVGRPSMSRAICGSDSATRDSMPSSRCLPSSSGSGSSIG